MRTVKDCTDAYKPRTVRMRTNEGCMDQLVYSEYRGRRGTRGHNFYINYRINSSYDISSNKVNQPPNTPNTPALRSQGLYHPAKAYMSTSAKDIRSYISTRRTGR